jgi:hypothetical protein
VDFMEQDRVGGAPMLGGARKALSSVITLFR